jgi:endonuclease YncB( thermonuclease family)
MTVLATLIRRGRVAALGGLLVLTLAALALVVGPRPEIAERAQVIDGDSLKVARTEIRLYGVDAPEHRQICERAGQPWACGVAARSALEGIIAGRAVTCRLREEDRYGRSVAICFAGGVDIGAAMVRAGHAVAFGAYEADERDARDARRGLWSSTFERPAAWRARHPGHGR